MITDKQKAIFYQAFLDKKKEYEGIFFVRVKTTGVFCRPTCPARKPKLQNCEFFENVQQALLASFRPCKRCRPLSHPNHVSKLVQRLVKLVDENIQKRWKDKDLKELLVDASTARRQFKKRFGMTFVEYARAKRMDLARKQLRKGETVIEAQLSSGYESGSGFRDAFLRIMGTSPSKKGNDKVLKASWLDTPLGPMIALADEQALYLLEFADRPGLEKKLDGLRQKTKSVIIPGHTKPISSIENELNQYFAGKLKIFKTPLFFIGSFFQKKIWEELLKIPLGETRSYSDIAVAIKKPTAFRAVAQANGSNRLAIIVPCHRVINVNGELGGYAGGLVRKKWLLHHEKDSK